MPVFNPSECPSAKTSSSVPRERQGASPTDTGVPAAGSAAEALIIAKPRCLAQEGPRSSPESSTGPHAPPRAADAHSPPAQPRAGGALPPPVPRPRRVGGRRPHPEGGGVGDEGELQAEVGEPLAVPHLLRVPRRHPPAPQHLPPPAAARPARPFPAEGGKERAAAPPGGPGGAAASGRGHGGERQLRRRGGGVQGGGCG